MKHRFTRVLARLGPIATALSYLPGGILIAVGLQYELGANGLAILEVRTRISVALALIVIGVGAIVVAVLVSWLRADARARDAVMRSLHDSVDKKVSEAASQARAEELETQEAVRLRLIGQVQHEIVKPLGVAHQRLRQMVVQAEAAGCDATALETIDQPIARILEIGNQLGTLVRLNEVLDPEKLEPVDLGAVVREAVKHIEQTTAYSDRKIDIRDPAWQVGTVMGNRPFIVVLFRNILDNAVKYSSTGSHVLVDIRFDIRAAPPTVTVEITDNGSGIKSDELALVFEELQRGSNAACQRIDGYGLGLPLARGIAVALGGSLELVSRGPDRGTQVTVTLPIADRELETECNGTVRPEGGVLEPDRSDDPGQVSPNGDTQETAVGGSRPSSWVTK